MAIYTNWGSQIKIIENCGKPKPKGFKFPTTLVKIRYEDDGRERYAFAEFLRADNGAVEIEQEICGLQVIILDKETLKKAIRQAL